MSSHSCLKLIFIYFKTSMHLTCLLWLSDMLRFYVDRYLNFKIFVFFSQIAPTLNLLENDDKSVKEYSIYIWDSKSYSLSIIMLFHRSNFYLSFEIRSLWFINLISINFINKLKTEWKLYTYIHFLNQNKKNKNQIFFFINIIR